MSKAERILEAVKSAEASVTGTLGFSFYDLQTGEACYHHGDEMFPTASVYKVYILAELYRQAAAEIVDLSAMVQTPTGAPCIGSGILQELAPEISLSIRDMAKLMMILSDNVATDILFNLVGRENILKNVIEALELNNTKADYSCTDMMNVFYRITPDIPEDLRLKYTGSATYRNSPEYTCRTELSNCTSPKDITVLFKALYEGKWVSKEVSREILNMMRPQPMFTRIAKYLPKGVRVARKGGSMDRVVNDTGIVYSPHGDYIITMFYNGNTASEEEYLAQGRRFLGEDLTANLSKRVYEIFADHE